MTGLKHPGRWVWLLLAVPIVLGALRLRFDAEVFDLLPGDLKAVAGLKIYQKYFSNARELIITLDAPDGETGESAARAVAEKLRAATNLVESVTWQPPWLEHPDQAGELIAALWLNQPPAHFAELTNRLAPQNLAEVLSATREELATSMSPAEIGRLSYDPYGLTRLPESAQAAAPSFAEGQEMFSSADGKFRLIFLKAAYDLPGYRDCDRWLKQIKALVAESATNSLAGKTSSSLRFNYTGRPAFVAEVATGMERDMTGSVGGTAVIIAILFYLAHRRFKPMLWLLVLLTLILGSTLALGGLIYGTVNVVSMGFAAILLGLAVDYAVVHYQEALAHPALSVPQIRSGIAPSIFWAAVTTISAFLVLNFGGLPGLGQLGTLVGLGVALAAIIMIFEFLPHLFPERKEPRPELESQTPMARDPAPPSSARGRVIAAVTVAVITLAVLTLALRGLPRIDPTANALRPRKSSAYDALARIQQQLSKEKEPLWVIVQGNTVQETAQRLDAAQAILNEAVSNHWLKSVTLPATIWPRPDFQTANRPAAAALVARRSLLHQAAQTNGFAPNAMALSDRILDSWQAAQNVNGVFWPTNPMSRWILEKVAASAPGNFFALGFLAPEKTDAATLSARVETLQSKLPGENFWISGWELLGHAIFSRVKANMFKVLAPMALLVMVSLWLAFKRPGEILLSLGVLALSGLALLAVMQLWHWSWNLLNLMAIPLILGTGVDYSIFMQLALRRYHGDLPMAYRAVGRALLLCGGTAIAGFGSLSWSSNAGMASLGQVCAVGIGFNMLIAIFLLPWWWYKAARR